MANTIITKNSATATAVPTAGQLVQGELAVNVTDKRLFTENSGGTVVEVGTNPSTIAVAGNATVGGTLGVTGLATLASSTLTANPTLSAGTANGVAYLNGSKVLASGSALTFDGTTLQANKVYAPLAISIRSSTFPNNYNLHVSQDDSTAALAKFTNTTTGVATTDGFDVGINSAEQAYVWNNENTAMLFGVNNTEAMRLTSTGLGIGTSSPISKLTVLGAGTINAPETNTTGASIQTASYGITTRTGNLELGATDALAANIGGSLSFSARYSGANATWVTGKIGAYRDTATSGVASSYLAFATTTGAGDLTERVRIDSSGQVLIGNTTAALGTGFANRKGRLHVGDANGLGGFGAIARVASGSSATFVAINNASYRVTVYSTHDSTSARIGQYIFIGLNGAVVNPAVLTLGTTGSPDWTFTYSTANANDTLVTVAASSDNQNTRIIVEQLGDA